MPEGNRQVLLQRRPTGMPVPEDFQVVDRPLPEPAAGEVLLRGIYLSLDPYMRGRISGVSEDSIHHAVHGLVKFSHQPGIGFLRTRLQFLNNGGFLRADSNRASEISQTDGSRHACHGDTPYYTSVGKPLLPEQLDNRYCL